MSTVLDLAKLDKEVILLVTEFEVIVPKLKELESELVDLKWQLEKKYAELDKEIRNQRVDKKRTEKQIEMEIINNPEYQQLMGRYLTVKKEFLTYKAKRDILYQKYNGIQTLVDLFKVRYFGDCVDIDNLRDRTKEIMDTLSFRELDEVLR